MKQEKSVESQTMHTTLLKNKYYESSIKQAALHNYSNK